MPWRRFSARAVSTRSADADRAGPRASGRRLDRPDHVGARVVVLLIEKPAASVASSRATVSTTPAGVFGETILRVDVERHIDRGGERDTWSMNNSSRPDLLILAAERSGEPGAGGGERAEAERGQHLGRADVPRVGHHEDARGGLGRRVAVQVGETRPAGRRRGVTTPANRRRRASG